MAGTLAIPVRIGTMMRTVDWILAVLVSSGGVGYIWRVVPGTDSQLMGTHLHSLQHIDKSIS